VATEVYPRVVPTVAVVGSCKKTKGRVLSHLTRRRNKREKTSSTKKCDKRRGIVREERTRDNGKMEKHGKGGGEGEKDEKEMEKLGMRRRALRCGPSVAPGSLFRRDN